MPKRKKSTFLLTISQGDLKLIPFPKKKSKRRKKKK